VPSTRLNNASCPTMSCRGGHCSKSRKPYDLGSPRHPSIFSSIHLRMQYATPCVRSANICFSTLSSSQSICSCDSAMDSFTLFRMVPYYVRQKHLLSKKTMEGMGGHGPTKKASAMSLNSLSTRVRSSSRLVRSFPVLNIVRDGAPERDASTISECTPPLSSGKGWAQDHPDASKLGIEGTIEGQDRSPRPSSPVL
jgi:hypothetical protein